MIDFIQPEDRVFRRALDSTDDAKVLDTATKADNQVEMFIRYPGSEADPQLLEIRYPPGTKASSHAHETDEIIFVTEGELHFGGRVCPAGASVLIPRLTLYSVAAGPEGATFLNFRAHSDTSVIRPDELAARRDEVLAARSARAQIQE